MNPWFKIFFTEKNKHLADIQHCGANGQGYKPQVLIRYIHNANDSIPLNLL